MTPYPRRPSHFAHHFVRVLHKSCAAQDIGPTACYLLCIVAHTEDAARYVGPARFWNSQLMETMGFSSPKQLEAARDRAIEAGWLQYNRAGNRAVGEYYVTIPDRFQGLTDAPIEERVEAAILSPGGMNSGTNQTASGEAIVPFSTQIGDGKRNEKVTESGKPSYPIPSPIPNTDTHAGACSVSVAAPPKSKPRTKTPKTPPVVPAVLDTPEFAAAWNDWQQHRRQRDRKPLTDTTLSRQLATLEAMGSPQAAVASIYQSIERGWSGLFAVDASGRSSRPSSPSRVHTPGRYDGLDRRAYVD